MELESTKRTIRIFGKYFLPIFILAFIVINWMDFSWAFNYRVLGSLVSEKLQAEEPVVDNETETQSNSTVNVGKKAEAKEIDNLIEIPKIGISAPIIFPAASTTEERVHELLDSGTVHYPSSALPGEEGETIILGHSAPENWPKIKYDWVFSDLDSLAWGDEILVYFEGEKHVYLVEDKIFIERGEELPKENYVKGENTIILLSCWPPGKNIRRIAVIAR